MGKFNLREALRDKKKRNYIYYGAAIAVILLLLLLPGGKKKEKREATFSTERETQTSQQEIDEILRRLKEAKKKESTTGKETATTAPIKPTTVETEDPVLRRRLEALHKKMEYFKVEKQEKELEMERLALQAKMLSIVAKIKSAEKKMEKLEEDPSNVVVVYDASRELQTTGASPERSEKKGQGSEEVVPVGEQIVVPAGTFIDGIIENEIKVNNGEVAPALVVIDKKLPNLYKKGKFLFPRGTKFVGKTISFGTTADRILFVFDTVVLPDGRHIPLEQDKKAIENMNLAGVRGNASSVNRHFLEIALKSAVVGLLQAVPTLATPLAGGIGYPGAGIFPYGPGAPQTGEKEGQGGFNYGKYSREIALREALTRMTQRMGSSVSSTIQQKTTITIKAGTRVKLFVSKKIVYNI